jgi:tetratricopeptide (TPR) repeat protein
MEENTSNLREKLENLSNKKKFEKIIALLTPEVLEKEKDKVAELYIWRGNARYSIKDYDSAMADYNKAIEINPNYELAFYNRT